MNLILNQLQASSSAFMPSHKPEPFLTLSAALITDCNQLSNLERNVSLLGHAKEQ